MSAVAGQQVADLVSRRLSDELPRVAARRLCESPDPIHVDGR